MGMMQQRVTRVFRDVFDDDAMQVWDGMSAKDDTRWDSLTQVKLIIGLEEEFGIKFSTHDLAALQCVGDVKRCLSIKGIPE